VRRYAAELVAVLSHLHDHGVVYVDLKPENVLLQDCGHIMLCDMDLAHTQTEIQQIQELDSGAHKRLSGHFSSWLRALNS
jgi:serine/threonine protein kinase